MPRRSPLLAVGLAALLAVPAAGQPPAPTVTADPATKTVTVPATVAPRKLAHLQETYPIEVIACYPHPKGKKAHETVLTIDVAPSAVHKALEAVGLKPGKPAKGEGATPEGPEVNLFIEVPQPDGAAKRLTLDKVLIDPKTKKPLPKGVKVRFTGSVTVPTAPDDPKPVYGADQSGTLIAVFPVTDETVLQTSLTMKEEKFLKMDVNKAALPPEGTAVKLILEVAGK